MEYRVLGALEVRDGEESLPLGGAKQRALLALFLVHANEVVARDRLIDQLWGDHPPETAVQTVQVYVSRLRKLLPRDSLLTRPPGYLLQLDPDRLDLHRFERLHAVGREALAAGDADRAARVLRESLALWRGPALAEFAAEPFAQPEIARLGALRLAAVEERVEADLALGRQADLVGELEALIAEHPYRERLRGQLMLALYRSGRQAEALEAYQHARRVLLDELGIDPSADLQRLEKQILTQDEALASPPRLPVAVDGDAPVDAGVAAASPEVAAPDVRKTVTVLFADLVGSTRLGRQLDPEGLRRLLSRYFEEMRAAVERHGGVVEKFIGDAVMAVFGVPVLHEDDALRAVRAATEMRESLAALNRELEQSWGVSLECRIGINTGEVVAGDHLEGHSFVTGAVVNVAKRLEEAAGTGEILLCEATHRLVRDAVVVEPVEGRAAKGGNELGALRLVEVLPRAAGRARRFDSPLVGREPQVDALRAAFADVRESRTCHLLTVLGPAGIGKSRLVQEFLGEVGPQATVLRGHCLPYGEGITYWPLIEAVRELVRTEGGGEEPSREAIAALLPDDEKGPIIAELISDSLGFGGAGAHPGETTFWAVRKLFEALARRRPLVVVLDDLQWAEPTFVELVDYLAGLSRDAPILLLCMARPEILDGHPGWGSGRANASTILLEPLDDDDCRTLIANLLGRGPLPVSAETRIAGAAEGNALFAEELVAMLLDDERLAWDGSRWVAADALLELPVPQTIQTLLAARLEGLPEDERALLLRASVEGTLFHRSAVGELAPEVPDDSVEASLGALVRRDLIRPDRPSFAGDEAYRFRHRLIREAAYRSLAKASRAELHERFAGWLERTAVGRLREYEEIVGYHLEQAYRCRASIGAIDAHAASLATGAAERLEPAGRRALARGDLQGAIGLLERAADLLVRDEPRRAALLPELGAALIEIGRLGEAETVLAEARELAAAAGDERADAHALVQQQFLQLVRVAGGGTPEAARAVERVLPVFDACGDDHGLSRAHRLQAWLHWNAARAAAATDAWEQAAADARRAGDEEERSEILNWIASSMFFGPTPVAEGIRRCDEIRVEVSGNLAAEAWTLRSLAGLHAMDGRFELARELLAESTAIFDELGQTLNSSVSHVDGIVEMLAGDAVAAEARLLAGYNALEEMGDKAFLSTTAAYLAQAVYAQGRGEEAARYTRISEELADRDDLLTQVIWRGTRARVLAGQGRMDEAEALAREAVAMSEPSDFVATRAEALAELAEVMQQTGRVEEAKAAAVEALDLYEQKGASVAVRTIKQRFAVLSHV